MTMNNNNFFRLIFNKFTNFLDFVLLILSIVYLMISLSNIIIYFIDIIFNSTYIPVFNMSDVTTTNVQISTDSTIADGIRTLLIYGFGGMKLHALRSGTPSSRFIALGATVLTDNATKFLSHTVNDPTFLRSHIENWKIIYKNATHAEIDISGSEATVKEASKLDLSSVNNTPKFLPDGNFSIEDLSNKGIEFILEFFRDLIAPQPSPFSNEVLSLQKHDITILLFFLSIGIFILIIFLLFNILLVLNGDRLKNYFKNKYIKWYIDINIKFITIEAFISGSLILMFMFELIKGILYLVQHPLIII